MLNRKIEDELSRFIGASTKEAILLTGARQVGKTFIIREVARRSGLKTLEINFIKEAEAKILFKDLRNEQDFFVRLSSYTDEELKPGEMLIFFDEVQECPEVVTYIKFLVDDGRYRYILSGSLLGVELKDLRSAPVGYLRELQMYPLDFEEFVRALGTKDVVLDHVRSAWERRTAVDPVVHTRMMDMFRLYLVVGGMPAAVQRYLDTKNISDVVQIQRGIVREYRKDATKYDKGNKLQIERTLDLIPEELNRKNKRFVVADLKDAGRFDRLEANFVWLSEAGIGLTVCSVADPRVPLRLTRDSAFFKLFLNDVGLLASLYMDGIQLKILSGETDINFGAVYENFVAQELHAGGFPLYYFSSRKVGEVDFIIEYEGKAEPVEVKSGAHYRSHAALDRLLGIPAYSIGHAFVLGNANYSRVDKIEYLPIYFTMFLKKDTLPPDMVYELPERDVRELEKG